MRLGTCLNEAQVDHGTSHAQQGAGIRYLLQPRNGRLRTQFAVRGSEVMRHFEHRIGAKTVGVVAVLVAGGDHVTFGRINATTGALSADSRSFVMPEKNRRSTRFAVRFFLVRGRV